MLDIDLIATNATLILAATSLSTGRCHVDQSTASPLVEEVHMSATDADSSTRAICPSVGFEDGTWLSLKTHRSLTIVNVSFRTYFR
jgi:hypothetical protein